jgi:hypothetical protein
MFNVLFEANHEESVTCVYNTHSEVKDCNFVIHTKNMHKDGQWSYDRYEENVSQEWEKIFSGKLVRFEVLIAVKMKIQVSGMLCLVNW